MYSSGYTAESAEWIPRAYKPPSRPQPQPLPPSELHEPSASQPSLKDRIGFTIQSLRLKIQQEARGLDAGPRLVQKLVGFGDHRTSDIVAKIAEEEVAHVAVGVFWFLFVCQKLGRTPCATFKDILKDYNVELKGPFNYSARDEAGIPREWYDGSAATDETRSKLSEVHDRLADIIAMEKENSSLNS